MRLTFTPTVIGERVHLKVRPEVSVLDFNNAVVFSGFRIPALTTRRTETELELNNGQTFAIAGLLNNSMTQTLAKVPGIGDIPILGYLFRSKAARKDHRARRDDYTADSGTGLVRRDQPAATPAGTYMPRLQNESLPNPPAPFTGTGK